MTPRPVLRRELLLALAATSLIACGGSDSTAVPQKAAGRTLVSGPRFTDVLADSSITFRHHFLDSESGSSYRINPYDHGSGVFVADVNQDGLEDLYFLDFLGPAALYLNQGGFKFVDATASSGLAIERALKVGAAFGDFDDDGDPDLYVTTYRGGNHLFRNRGDATFEEITATAGVGYKGHSNGATWLDFDLDGDLDLYLCNIGKFTTDTISQEADWFYTGVSLPFAQVAQTPDARVGGEPDILYRNNGDATFTDVTEAAGIHADEWNGDAAVADIDLDGDPDLYVSNMFGANHLYRNRGDGTFEDITASALQRTSWGGMGARFFDANGDEFPDLYVVDMHSDMWTKSDQMEQVQEGAKFNTPLGLSVGGGKRIARPEDTQAKSVLFGNTYFENQGGGRFLERSSEAGLENWWPWGSAAGDWNDDGAEDLFVPAGMGYPYAYWPNALLMNETDAAGKGHSAHFADAARAAGIEPPRLGERIAGADIAGKPAVRSSRAAACADLDGDGDLDLVVNNFNHEPYLFRNDSPKSNALLLRLVGDPAKRCPRDAIAARVQVKAGGRTWTRQVTGAQGYLAQSSAVLHFGLGTATAVESVEIHWPGSAEPQVLHSPALNQVVTVAQQ
jgi:enediyne biosynthesis protein E4